MKANPTFAFVQSRDGGQWIVNCPQCGCEYTHLQRTWALEGSDPFEGASECGELFGVPVGGTTGSRRGVLVMEFACENGWHRFRIELTNHRGETMVDSYGVEGCV